MFVTILAHLYRRAGTSPEHFKLFYERHVIILQELMGPNFPQTHKRTYIARSDSPEATGTTRNTHTPAVLLRGQQEEFDFDAIAELTFVDSAALEAFLGKMSDPHISRRLEEDEEQFLDRKVMGAVMVGGIRVTGAE